MISATRITAKSWYKTVGPSHFEWNTCVFSARREKARLAATLRSIRSRHNPFLRNAVGVTKSVTANNINTQRCRVFFTRSLQNSSVYYSWTIIGANTRRSWSLRQFWDHFHPRPGLASGDRRGSLLVNQEVKKKRLSYSVLSWSKFNISIQIR